jgi:hypothetical protein
MRNTNARVTDVREGYIVRTRETGTAYIAERANRTEEGKYRWVKDKSYACYLSYNAAQKVRQRYGGTIVRVTQTVTEQNIG